MPWGVAVDIARELGRRLGVPVEIVPYEAAGAFADAATSGAWDVGFLGAEPQRASVISFTAAYAEIESTYLVPPGSPLQRVDEVDREGLRIAIAAKSAYDLGRDAGAAYLRAFVEDLKASGFVTQAIERNAVRGLTVAPPAGSQEASSTFRRT